MTIRDIEELKRLVRGDTAELDPPFSLLELAVVRSMLVNFSSPPKNKLEFDQAPLITPDEIIRLLEATWPFYGEWVQRLIEVNIQRETRRANLLSNFWIDLEEDIPRWQKGGEVVKSTLPYLLEIVHAYLSSGDYRAKIRELSQHLDQGPAENKNRLLSVKLTFGEGDGEQNGSYLLNILIDLYQKKPEQLDKKVMAVAAWLCKIDRAYTIDPRQYPAIYQAHRCLYTVYEKYNAGPAFKIDLLKRFLIIIQQQFTEFPSSRLEGAVAKLKEAVKGKRDYNPEILQLIVNLYQVRAYEIQRNYPHYNYTRCRDGINEVWITFAQLLQGAGLLETSYYRLLIPTLESDTDEVYGASIIDYPLDHCILDKNAKYLTILPVIVEQYKVYGVFRSLRGPLTPWEIEQIHYANPRFHRYQALAISSVQPVPSIPLAIIYDVLQPMINEGFYPEGLKPTEFPASLDAKRYEAFQGYCKKIAAFPKEVQERLRQQRILLHGRYRLVDEIFNGKFEHEWDSCATNAYEYLLKLILDYAHYRVEYFRPDIQEHIVSANLTRYLEPKVPTDYEHISESEARRRLLVLAVFLQVDRLGQNDKIADESIWDPLPEEANDLPSRILKILMPLIQQENFVHARSVYVRIVETEFKLACKEITDSKFPSWLCSKKYNEYKEWAMAVQDESFFFHHHWFEPAVLLQGLHTPLRRTTSFGRRVETFLEEIVQIYVRSDATSIENFLTNVKLGLLVKSAGSEAKSFHNLLNELAEKMKNFTASSLGRFIGVFIIDRILSICSFFDHKPKPSYPSHFTAPATTTDIPPEIRELKQQTLSTHSTPAETVENIITTVKSITSIPDRDRDKILEYLGLLVNTESPAPAKSPIPETIRQSPSVERRSPLAVSRATSSESTSETADSPPRQPA